MISLIHNNNISVYWCLYDTKQWLTVSSSWGSDAILWQFHRNCSRYQSVKWVWKIHLRHFNSTSLRGQWVKNTDNIRTFIWDCLTTTWWTGYSMPLFVGYVMWLRCTYRNVETDTKHRDLFMNYLKFSMILITFTPVPCLYMTQSVILYWIHMLGIHTSMLFRVPTLFTWL